MAHDALEFLFGFLVSVNDLGREQGYVLTHPDWVEHAINKAEIGLAATKHKRI